MLDGHLISVEGLLVGQKLGPRGMYCPLIFSTAPD